jgi:hypothetical protein
MFVGKARAYPSDPPSSAKHWNRLLALPTNIKLEYPTIWTQLLHPNFPNVLNKLECLSLETLLQPSLMFVGKARAYRSEPPFKC